MLPATVARRRPERPAGEFQFLGPRQSTRCHATDPAAHIHAGQTAAMRSPCLRHECARHGGSGRARKRRARRSHGLPPQRADCATGVAKRFIYRHKHLLGNTVERTIRRATASDRRLRDRVLIDAQARVAARRIVRHAGSKIEAKRARNFAWHSRAGHCHTRLSGAGHV